MTYYVVTAEGREAGFADEFAAEQTLTLARIFYGEGAPAAVIVPRSLLFADNGERKLPVRYVGWLADYPVADEPDAEAERYCRSCDFLFEAGTSCFGCGAPGAVLEN